MRCCLIVLALGTLLAGCNTVTVNETVLSTNQRLAMVSNPGDGVTPPATVVLLERGTYVPVSTGYGQAPLTALVGGLGTGAAIAASSLAVAGLDRPARTSVTATASADGGSRRRRPRPAGDEAEGAAGGGENGRARRSRPAPGGDVDPGGAGAVGGDRYSRRSIHMVHEGGQEGTSVDRGTPRRDVAAGGYWTSAFRPEALGDRGSGDRGFGDRGPAADRPSARPSQDRI